MRKLIVSLALMMAASNVVAADPDATPEATLIRFSAAMEAGDGKAMGACFKTGEFGRKLLVALGPFAKAAHAFSVKMTAAYGEDAVEKLDTDVDISFLMRFAHGASGRTKTVGDWAYALVPGQDLVRLIRENETWLIFHSSFADASEEEYDGFERMVGVMLSAVQVAMEKVGREGETVDSIAKALRDAIAAGHRSLPPEKRSPERLRVDLEGKLQDAVYEFIDGKDALPESAADLGVKFDPAKYRVRILGDKFDPKVKVERLDDSGKVVPIVKSPAMIREEAAEAVEVYVTEHDALPENAEALGLEYDRTRWEVVLGGRLTAPLVRVVPKGTPHWMVLGAGKTPKETLRSMAHALFGEHQTQLGDCYSEGTVPGALYQAVVAPSVPVIRFSLKLEIAYGEAEAAGVLMNLGFDQLLSPLRAVMASGKDAEVTVSGDSATVRIPGCAEHLTMRREGKVWRIADKRVMAMTEEQVEAGSDAADAMERALREAGQRIGGEGETAATIEVLVKDHREAALIQAAFSRALFQYNVEKKPPPDDPAKLGVKYDATKWKVSFETSGGWTNVKVERRK